MKTPPKRLVILLSGSGSNFQSIAENCIDGAINGEIVAVISENNDAYGLVRAAQLGIPTKTVPFEQNSREQWERKLIKTVASYKPDFVLLAGFMKILSPKFVEVFKDNVLNIHPSLLPKYKGLNTHQRAIDAGDKEAGCSVHIVTERLDDGPILGQRKVTILKDDTAETLANRIIIEEHKLYSDVLKKLCAI